MYIISNSTSRDPMDILIQFTHFWYFVYQKFCIPEVCVRYKLNIKSIFLTTLWLSEKLHDIVNYVT